MTDAQKAKMVQAFLFDASPLTFGIFFQAFQYFGDSSAAFLEPLLKQGPLTRELVSRTCLAIGSSFANLSLVDWKFRQPIRTSGLIQWLKLQDLDSEAQQSVGRLLTRLQNSGVKL